MLNFVIKEKTKSRYRNNRSNTIWKDDINNIKYYGYQKTKVESINSTNNDYVSKRSEGNLCQPNYQKNISDYRKKLVCPSENCKSNKYIQYVIHDVKTNNKEEESIYSKKAYNSVTKPTNTILSNDIKYSSSYKEYLRKNNLTYEQNLYDHSFNCIKPIINSNNNTNSCTNVNKQFQFIEANKYPNLKRYNNISNSNKCNKINTRLIWGPITSSGLITEKKYKAIKSNLISNNKNCATNEFFDFNIEMINKKNDKCFIDNKCINYPGTGKLTGKGARGAKTRILK